MVTTYPPTWTWAMANGHDYAIDFDAHPWRTDVRKYARILEGGPLPHKSKECKDCRAVRIARKKYKAQGIRLAKQDKKLVRRTWIALNAYLYEYKFPISICQ